MRVAVDHLQLTWIIKAVHSLCSPRRGRGLSNAAGPFDRHGRRFSKCVDIVVSATIPQAHSEALSFWVDTRECDWHPPSPSGRTAGHSAVAACAAAAPGAGYAREADFNMWHPDGSARAFIHIAAGATSGELRLPVVTGDGAEGSEAIAFMVNPYGNATRAYLRYLNDWYHPDTSPDGYAGNVHPLWVATIEASQSSPMLGSEVPNGAQVGEGRTQSEPSIDATLVAAVRDLAGQTHHGQAHVDRWRRVLIAFGLETYDGLTAITETEARDNAAALPRWPPTRSAPEPSSRRRVVDSGVERRLPAIRDNPREAERIIAKVEQYAENPASLARQVTALTSLHWPSRHHLRRREPYRGGSYSASSAIT